MIRRLREHVAKQNWFAVALDFAIVVIGVFLGLQVNNWNQMRVDRDRGADYRARLSDELRTTENALRGLGAYANAAKASGAAALTVLNDAKAPAGGTFLFDAYQASQVVPRSGRHATYDEIIQSGALADVGPPALRDKISNFYWRMDGTLSLDAGSSAYREKLRMAMPNVVQEAIRAKCDERLADAGNGLIIASLPQKCDPEIDSMLASRAASRLRVEPGLADALNRQLSALDSRSFNYAKLAANARQLRGAIERYGR
jgi:hypothetical protein